MTVTENINEQKTYSYEEALNKSIEYFNGNEFSAKVFIDKYALRNNKLEILEPTPKEMHIRLAKEFARIEAKKFKKPLTFEQIYNYFDKFGKIIPQGSPCYGIGNEHQYVSISNCFVIASPEDSYGGICKADEELAQISKRRGGVGLSIENLRPSGCLTRNSSRTSTGQIPFAKRFSNTIREVGQDGRRGAEMITNHIHHPQCVTLWDETEDGKPYVVEINDKDIGHFFISSVYYNPNKIDFVTCKYDKKQVTGANISVKTTDEFLNAVEKNELFEQRWPVDTNNPIISKKISAKKAWDKIIHSAWQTAEPGILFWDHILRESPADCYAKYGFRTISTNPCGEIPLSAYDSCRLLLLNLFGFVKNPFTKKAYFDYKEFFEAAKIAQRLMEDLVDLEDEAISRIIKKIENDPEDISIKFRELELWKKVLDVCRKGRRTGTGLTALGDTLGAINISYASNEGIEVTERIYKTLKFAAYQSSIEMAKELGPFSVWDHELEKNNPFLLRIKEETVDLGDGEIVSGNDLWNLMKKYGRRNIALLTTAPAGTVSILAKLVNHFDSSSGIEPEFSIKPYIRRKKINPSDKGSKIDFKDQNGDCWQEFIMHRSIIKEWMEVTGETDIAKSPFHGSCAEEIDWKLRVKLQAAAQKHVDHSISSTINLPEDVTVEKVAEIYETAWKAGCKGITVYRKNCRTGVLVDIKNTNNIQTQNNTITKTNAPKRPDKLPCDIHHIKISKKSDTSRIFEYVVLVGILNDEPYEIFATENGFVDKKYTKGLKKKKKRGEYYLQAEDGTVLISNITKNTTEEEDALTRITSTALRHGADTQFVVHQLEKVKGDDLYSFSKAMSRSLKKYIKDGTKITGETCPKCKSDRLIRQSGCAICLSCGESKCLYERQNMPLKFKKNHKDAIIPKYQTAGSAGFDFHAIVDPSCPGFFCPGFNNVQSASENIGNEKSYILIPAKSQQIIRTGLCCAIPDGFEIQIRPRSGLAAKNCITITNSPGTIDCFTEDMMIETIDGKKQIHDVKIGDIVLSVNENMEIEKDEIVAKVNKGEMLSIAIETEDGNIIEISENTEVYTNNGVKLAKELQEGDFLISL